ncbi:M16 family peptidase [Ehrlichia ruminantium]|uniref:M16 family metallopeptidase n=1 Tax=Ehrlichia ruminantium TaxID=779 RepID=UPI0007C1109C|nr:pitrilysin family protein [Ehrlichia ruminantium]QLK52739.1 insulinase family protein [Ehrlichia ruminantium]QLK54573.1 insulinase family protein [Ehrlichia ruminantium]QLK57322.1 insulinase family protein [Ehrlichia ruminantium]GAT76672.1 M16 family peptidase [Ehrlichia ruminantium]
MRNVLYYITTLILFIGSFYNAYADNNININIQKATTKNNVSYLYVEHHNLPIISLTLAFKKAGYAYDTPDKQGLAYFTSQILKEGSQNSSGIDFIKQLESKGIELTFNIDQDNFYITVKTLSENLEYALSLLSDCLLYPTNDDEIFDRVKDEQITQIKSLYSAPNFIAESELFNAIFEGHPYSNRDYGTISTVSNINEEDVQSYIKSSFDKNQIVISAAGDINPTKLSNLLDKYLLSKLPSGNNNNTISDTTINKKNHLLYVARDIPQSVIMFAIDGVPYNNKDYYAADLFNTILGGLSLNSILMIELRDKLGLTYHTSTKLDNMDHSNILKGVLYTDSTTVTKCMSVFKETIENIKNNGIDEMTFSNAKSSIINSFVLSLLNNDNVADTLLSMQLYNLDTNYINQHSSYYEAITLDEVNRIAKKILSNDFVIIEVGKNNNIDGKEINVKQNILN